MGSPESAFITALSGMGFKINKVLISRKSGAWSLDTICYAFLSWVFFSIFSTLVPEASIRLDTLSLAISLKISLKSNDNINCDYMDFPNLGQDAAERAIYRRNSKIGLREYSKAKKNTSEVLNKLYLYKTIFFYEGHFFTQAKIFEIDWRRCEKRKSLQATRKREKGPLDEQ